MLPIVHHRRYVVPRCRLLDLSNNSPGLTGTIPEGISTLHALTWVLPCVFTPSDPSPFVAAARNVQHYVLCTSSHHVA